MEWCLVKYRIHLHGVELAKPRDFTLPYLTLPYHDREDICLALFTHTK